MKPYRFSPEAENDLLEIWAFSAQKWGEAQADKYLAELKLTTLRYARGELIGRSCSRFLPERPEFLYFLHVKHFVIYRLNGGVLEIAAVIHGSSQEKLLEFLRSH